MPDFMIHASTGTGSAQKFIAHPMRAYSHPQEALDTWAQKHGVPGVIPIAWSPELTANFGGVRTGAELRKQAVAAGRTIVNISPSGYPSTWEARGYQQYGFGNYHGPGAAQTTPQPAPAPAHVQTGGPIVVSGVRTKPPAQYPAESCHSKIVETVRDGFVRTHVVNTKPLDPDLVMEAVRASAGGKKRMED